MLLCLLYMTLEELSIELDLKDEPPVNETLLLLMLGVGTLVAEGFPSPPTAEHVMERFQ